jgi:hypothetical protein
MSPSSTALNGCVSFHSGYLRRECLHPVEGEGELHYIGCPVHSVPSLSNTAMR